MKSNILLSIFVVVVGLVVAEVPFMMGAPTYVSLM